jgi:ParB-like chromosome segregation protein Spo0J
MEIIGGKTDWRLRLRQYLAEHVNERLVASEVFKHCETMPLYIATRQRVAAVKGRVARDLPHEELRWRVLVKTFSQLCVDCDPPKRRGVPMTRDCVIIPRDRECPCGKRFFPSSRGQLTCSLACGTSMGRARPKALHTIRKKVSIDQITVEDHHRPTDAGAVTQLVDSIKRIGLQTPIAVYDCDEGLFLVAGRHRIEAHVALGRDQIDAHVFTDKHEAELWSVAENLHRTELSALERSEGIDQWRRLTGRKAIKIQVGFKSSRRGRPAKGVAAAAEALGVSTQDVHRAAKIAKLSPEAKRVAREIGQDVNQAALLRAAEHDTPEDQIAALRESHTTKEHVDVRTSFCEWLDGLRPEDLDALLDLDLDALVAERVANVREGKVQ